MSTVVVKSDTSSVKLRVEAAIWRHALEIPALAALALAVLLVLGEALLVAALVPLPEVPAAAAS